MPYTDKLCAFDVGRGVLDGGSRWDRGGAGGAEFLPFIK